MKQSTSPRRERSAYNRALKMAKEAYWVEYNKDPGFVTPWAEFRRSYIQQAMATTPSTKPRGPRAAENPSHRQQYQQVYQKARRLAAKSYAESEALKRQFPDFGSYWIERKHTWLPAGFLKGRQATPAPKAGTPRTIASQAKDARTNYQIVYKYHARGWDLNINHCQERFGCWANYWAYLKANAFEPHNQAAKELDVVVYDDPRSADLHEKQLFDIPPKFPRPELIPVEENITLAPIIPRVQKVQSTPIPVAVYLDTDVIPDNSEWLVAA